jgi:hypothetical protein
MRKRFASLIVCALFGVQPVQAGDKIIVGANVYDETVLSAIFRCGALTQAGKSALAPM